MGKFIPKNKTKKTVKQRGLFFKIHHSGKVEILNYKLIQFLNNNGFYRMDFNGSILLVKCKENKIFEATDADLINCAANYLKKINKEEVLEKLVKGISGYLNKRKYDLFTKVRGFVDKDPKDEAWFYFKNTAVKINHSKIELINYDKLTHKIWGERILASSFISPVNIGKKSDFEDFCFKISKENTDRFLALKTALGYLLHRYNDPALTKAIIFVDENIAFDGTANGGTGKSLLSAALSKCKNIEYVEGKNTKTGSWFKNQRIKITTDIVVYDDVGRDFSLEEIYSSTTSGIVVEQKRKDELHIPPNQAPKFMISSNYIVKGTGGSSDIRRRYEFELANYFTEKHTPIQVYGKRFFEEWDTEDWSLFYQFLMECVQAFLKHGLVEAKPINLKRNRLINATCEEFAAFVKKHLKADKRFDKRVVIEKFKNEYKHLSDTSSKMFTSWLKEYCAQTDLDYSDQSSGSKLFFKMSTRKEVQDGN